MANVYNRQFMSFCLSITVGIFSNYSIKSVATLVSEFCPQKNMRVILVPSVVRNVLYFLCKYSGPRGAYHLDWSSHPLEHGDNSRTRSSKTRLIKTSTSWWCSSRMYLTAEQVQCLKRANVEAEHPPCDTGIIFQSSVFYFQVQQFLPKFPSSIYFLNHVHTC